MSMEEGKRFVQKMRAERRSDKEIAEFLRSAGWGEEDIERLLGIEDLVQAPAPPAAYRPPAVANNSGSGAAPPPEVAAMRWSWGAFQLTWIWGIGNSVWITFLVLLTFVPALASLASTGLPQQGIVLLNCLLSLLNLGFVIWLGLNGHSLAWKHRRFQSFEHFRDTMRVWNNWGLGLFIASVALIPIAAIMAAILFPVFSTARDKARQVACQSNTKQICLGFLMYAQDHNETFPNAAGWSDAIYPYVKNRQIFQCPDGDGYAMNPKVSGVPLTTIASPAQTVLLYDADAMGNPVYRHRGGINIGFVDGHVKWFSRTDAQAIIW